MVQPPFFEVTFYGKKDGKGGYATLDGAPITASRYSKHIRSVDELTDVEKDMLLHNYQQLKYVIQKIEETLLFKP